jgi:hypothetical protein
MSIRAGLIVTTVLACLSAGSTPRALAADPELRLPSLESLQRNATESVNVTIGPWPLSMASWVLDGSDNADDRDLREVLQGLKSINVRSFKFEADYDRSIVESVRSQLSTPGWNRLVQVRQHGDKADIVDIYVSTSQDAVNGLAIIASGPRELTIVNIAGSVDPAKLAKVSKRLGLPKLPM